MYDGTFKSPVHAKLKIHSYDVPSIQFVHYILINETINHSQFGRHTGNVS